MGKYASRSQSRIFTDKLNYYKHAILIPREDYNIVPLYSVSDTLISEASGALTEFLLTGKVGIIYSLDEKVITRSNSEPLLSNNNEFLKDIYIQITSPHDLGTALEKALAPDDNRLELVEQYKNKYFSKIDGNSSNRIKAYIDNMLL